MTHFPAVASISSTICRDIWRSAPDRWRRLHAHRKSLTHQRSSFIHQTCMTSFLNNICLWDSLFMPAPARRTAQGEALSIDQLQVLRGLK